MVRYNIKPNKYDWRLIVALDLVPLRAGNFQATPTKQDLGTAEGFFSKILDEHPILITLYMRAPRGCCHKASVIHFTRKKQFRL